MVQTNKSGQKLYPFNSTANSHKLFTMYNRVCNRIDEIQSGEPESYPSELEILDKHQAELVELTELCSGSGIIYLPGNLLSRAKEWVASYDTSE